MRAPRFAVVPTFLLAPLLLALAGCGDATAPKPAPGAIRVSLWSEHGVADSTRYVVTVDDKTSRSAGPREAVTFTAIAPGAHHVRLAGIPADCGVEGGAERSITVVAGEEVTVQMTVACAGSLVVTTVTTGDEIDADGYGVQLCGSHNGCDAVTARIDANGSVTLAPVEPGSYQVTLRGVATNCRPTTPVSVGTWVPSGGVMEVAFTIKCALPGSLRVINATSGSDPDADGYVLHLVGDTLEQDVVLAAGSSVTIPELFPAVYHLSVTGVAENCELAGDRSRDVEVQGGSASTVAFDLSCTPVTRLAFVMPGDGDDEIFAVNANGTGLTRLTSNGASDVDPAWSPGGARIAFASDREGAYDIYVMDADGSNVARLTTAGGRTQPAWSPDGRRIAFSGRGTGGSAIYVMDAVPGAEPVRLTSGASWDVDPAWSPDGSRIAFTSTRADVSDIYIVDVADPALIATWRLTSSDPGARQKLQPAWSPDGRRIAFVGTSCSSDYYCYDPAVSVYIANLDGTGLRKLSGTSLAWNSHPTWSPDGGTVAFSGYLDGCDGPCVLYARADGSFLDVITPLGRSPSWRR